MISKIDFNAKNLTSNAGLFLLLENAKSNGIFDLIENDLSFEVCVSGCKIIKTARYVILKLSENYPHRKTIRIRRRMNNAWPEKFRKQKECASKSLSVFVYAEMKVAREMNLKNDAKRSKFQEKGVTKRKILYNDLIFSKFIGNRSTVDDEF